MSTLAELINKTRTLKEEYREAKEESICAVVEYLDESGEAKFAVDIADEIGMPTYELLGTLQAASNRGYLTRHRETVVKRYARIKRDGSIDTDDCVLRCYKANKYGVN